jgi:alpha-tubulin suppressor-like RCC1 family protein
MLHAAKPTRWPFQVSNPFSSFSHSSLHPLKFTFPLPLFLFLTEYGDLWAWGRGREGQLGQGSRLNSFVPLRVEALKHERIVHADCGNQHCIAVTDTGKVYVWGRLYRESKDSGINYAAMNPTWEMPGLKTQEMVERSIAQYLSAGGEQDDEEQSQVNMFGKFEPYQQTTPLLLEPLLGEKVVAVAAGYGFSVCVTAEGEVYSW